MSFSSCLLNHANQGGNKLSFSDKTPRNGLYCSGHSRNLEQSSLQPVCLPPKALQTLQSSPRQMYREAKDLE